MQLEGGIEAHKVLTGFLDGLSWLLQGANENAFDLTKNAMCGASSNNNVVIKPAR